MSLSVACRERSAPSWVRRNSARFLADIDQFAGGSSLGFSTKQSLDWKHNMTICQITG